jgi:competence protein ComEC
MSKICFAFTASLVFLLSCTGGSFESTEKLQVEMLDVGQGLSFLIRSRGCNTLYDTGTPNSGIDSMLRNRGIKSLCSVILSHDHNDHAGGLPTLLKMAENGEISINRVLTSSEISRGDTLADFLPWTARILLPVQGSELEGNDASIVLRLSDSKNSFLFMGDLEEKQEKRLLEFEPLLTATSLQIGHHGSRTSSSWNFLAQIQPKMAFISAGKNNSYGHPHPETLAKLRLIMQDTTQIFRTDQNGSVEIEWVYGTGMWKVK